MSFHLLNKSPFCFCHGAFACGLSYQCFQISTFPYAADEIIEVITSIKKKAFETLDQKVYWYYYFFFIIIFIMVDSWGAKATKFCFAIQTWPSPLNWQDNSRHYSQVFCWDWSVNDYDRLDPELKASTNILFVFREKYFNSWLVSLLKLDILFLLWFFC